MKLNDGVSVCRMSDDGNDKTPDIQFLSSFICWQAALLAFAVGVSQWQLLGPSVGAAFLVGAAILGHVVLMRIFRRLRSPHQSGIEPRHIADRKIKFLTRTTTCCIFLTLISIVLMWWLHWAVLPFLLPFSCINIMMFVNSVTPKA